jgi:hypothetical protein
LIKDTMSCFFSEYPYFKEIAVGDTNVRKGISIQALCTCKGEIAI